MFSTDVCTTQEAAKFLSISVTSVQQLVESGVIEAWKTKGGHRRIPVAALKAYKASVNAGVQPSASAAGKNISVLVIEDNKMQRDLYKKKIGSWELPLTMTICESGYQALIEIAGQKPDVLLSDIVMEGIDGYEVVNTIMGYPELSEMNIAILSGLTVQELEKRGGIPEGVVFFAKPINFDELRGYLRACCAQKVRRAIAT